MALIARWCVRHRIIVLAVWILLLVGTAVASRRLGTEFTSGELGEETAVVFSLRGLIR